MQVFCIAESYAGRGLDGRDCRPSACSPEYSRCCIRCKVTRIEDKSSFIAATQSVYDQFRGVYGDEFMDTVLKAVGKA